MSQPDSISANPPRGVLVQKPKANIYTALLAVSLVSILVACLFLYLEINSYGAL